MSKTAVITGATSGIGAEYARRLAADGYDLIITGRRQEIIEKLADDLRKNHNVNVNVVIAELSDDNDIQKVIDAINAADDIEMLVNNAGYASEMKHCMEFELDDHEKLIKVHQIAPLRLIYAAVPKMIKKGKGNIVNVSSLGVYTPSPMTYSYTATKSYLKQFTEGLYQELKDNGIKVQVLCPAFTKTDFYRNIPEDEREKDMGAQSLRPMMSVVAWVLITAAAAQAAAPRPKRPTASPAVPVQRGDFKSLRSAIHDLAEAFGPLAQHDAFNCACHFSIARSVCPRRQCRPPSP